jgi:hypothetical protein
MKKVRTLSYPALKEQTLMPKVSTCLYQNRGSWCQLGLVAALVQWDIFLRLLNKT